MSPTDISREKLFALVWEKPATEVAKELGISDVALGKLCRRLQVPKPPRGYWARVRTGRTPRRPALPAFRAEVSKRSRRRTTRRGRRPSPTTPLIKLSERQADTLKRALRELDAINVDTSSCKLGYNGIRAIGEDLAARLIVLIQNRYPGWIDEAASRKEAIGAESSAIGLVTKLLRLARQQALVFQRELYPRDPEGPRPAAVVRCSSALLKTIAELHHLAREHDLSFAARSLTSTEFARLVRYLFDPGGYARVEAEICVSKQNVWLRCRVDDLWRQEAQFDTLPLPLRQVGPVELLPATKTRLPTKISPLLLRPYQRRLQALRRAEQVLDIISRAFDKLDTAIPDEDLALADRLWAGRDAEGPFRKARRDSQRMEAELEEWERSIDLERAEIAEDVLGIRPGDAVVLERRDEAVRIEVDEVSVYATDEGASFYVEGRRYRKDGLPGKRQEVFAMHVEGDLRTPEE